MNADRWRLAWCKRTGAMLLIMSAAFLAGCYYHVQDVRTGKAYFTDEWVAADGYRGPLTITDEAGRKIRIAEAHVVRIGKDEYVRATSEPAPAEE